MPITADLVRLMRECSGIGMADCHKAALMADKELGGDYVTALLSTIENQYAVSIKSRDPAVSPDEARRRWNLSNAMAARAERILKPGWKDLAGLCDSVYQGPIRKAAS